MCSLLDVRERLRRVASAATASRRPAAGPIETARVPVAAARRAAASGLQLPSAETTADSLRRRKLLESPRGGGASQGPAPPRPPGSGAAAPACAQRAALPSWAGSKRSVSSRASQCTCAASWRRRAPSAGRVSSRPATRALNCHASGSRRSPESKCTSRSSPAVGLQSPGQSASALPELRREQRRHELRGHERQALGAHAWCARSASCPARAPARTFSAGARSRRAPRVSCRSVKSSSKSSRLARQRAVHASRDRSARARHRRISSSRALACQRPECDAPVAAAAAWRRGCRGPLQSEARQLVEEHAPRDQAQVARNASRRRPSPRAWRTRTATGRRPATAAWCRRR